MWSIGIGRGTIDVIYPTVNQAYTNSGGEIHMFHPPQDILWVITTDTTVDNI